MSYWLRMGFIETGIDELLQRIREIKGIIYEKRYDVVNDNKYYIPSVRQDWELSTNRAKLRVEDEQWLDRVLTINFVYWEKYRLLGFVAPLEIVKQNIKYVEFQNSTDQDYEYSYWPKMEYFKAKVESYKGYSVEELQEKAVDLGKEYWNSEDFAEDSIDYIRRTLLYTEIYKELGLEDYLTDVQGSNSFERLDIRVIEGNRQRELYALMDYINACYHKEGREEE